MENTDVLQKLFDKRGDFKPRQISSQLHPCTGILSHFVGVIVRFTLCTAMLLHFVGVIVRITLCTTILSHFVGVIVRFTLCTAMLLNFVGQIFTLHTFNNQDKCDLSAITIIINSLDNP